MPPHATSSGRRRSRRIGLAALGAALSLSASAQADVILQYFESSWQTIERRMPDVFMAGYGAMWLPPAARADLGDFSVGFDVKDRFDLGNEFQKTLYGSETGLRRMISQAHRAGVLVYFDTVYNHNGFSDGYRGDIPNQTPCQLNWAIQEGGYPGFVMSGRDLGLPFNLEFRNVCPSAEFPIPSCDSDPINCRISNLIDINHNTDYRWIRHPADPNDSRNIPYQQAKDSNRRFYPDLDLPSPYDDGVRPFNLADEMQGDPFEENVNGMLQRATQWMLEVQGVDGFRLDAVKHTEAGWFSFIFDPIANDRRTDFWGRKVTPFSFGEHVTSDWGQLAAYHRKDGFGNRTVLDFPLKFTMQNNIGNPGGDFSQILDASFDGFDGDGQDGSAGVMFVQSHDNNFIGDPPALQNMAYAYILGRKGVPIVYYNAREFGADRFFPNINTRGDALGKYGSTITTLVNINNNFVNGRAGNGYRSLWRDNDYIAYELNNTLIVGLNDRQDQGGTGFGYDVRNVSNLGYRNVTLTEITGNAKDPAVDPNDDIPDTITIPASGGVDLRVPSARNRNGVEHGKPYVMYAIDPPKGALTVDNVAFTIAPDVVDEEDVVSVAKGRLTPIDVVTADVAQVRLQIDQTGTFEDNALLRWNFGQNVDGDDSGDFGIALGVDNPILAGYENFTTERSPSQGGGSGLYRLDVDLTDPSIPEGYNYLSAVAFVPRLEGLPPIFNTFRKVIYVDRRDPDMQLVFPANPDGTDDIQGTSYGFVVDNPDGTGNAMHYFWNLPEGTNPVDAGLLNDGNKATQTDRNRWRFSLDGLTSGDNQRLTVVLFEETGSYGLQTFLIGVDAGATPTVTPTGTPEPTSTPPITPTVSPTPTAGEGTPSPTSTPAPSPTIPEGTFTPTQTPNPTATVSPSASPSATAATATPTATEATPTPTATEATPSPTASATEATPTVAPTGTTATPSPSQTTAAPTATPSATPEPTGTTATPSPSATTPAGTVTPSPSATAPTATPSATETPLPSNPDGFLIRGGS